MNDMIEIEVLSEEGLAALKTFYSENFEKYRKKDKEFFKNFLKENNYLVKTNYKVRDFLKEIRYAKEDSDDLENIKTIYKAFIDLPIYLMMDDHFWACLTHTILFDYIVNRSETFLNETFDKKSIYNSFFSHNKRGVKRGTFVNPLSRLWWAGKFSYDSKRTEPFELTQELCKTGFPSTILLVSSSNITNNETVRLSFLDTIKNFRNKGFKVTRGDMTDGIKYLNIIGGNSLLDLYTFDEISKFLTEFYDSRYKNTNT